jgi:hypothetical protein
LFLPCFVSWCGTWLSIIHSIGESTVVNKLYRLSCSSSFLLLAPLQFQGVSIYVALLRPIAIILLSEYIFVFFVARRNAKLGSFGIFHTEVQTFLLGGVDGLMTVLSGLIMILQGIMKTFHGLAVLTSAIKGWVLASHTVTSGEQQDGYEANLQPPSYTVSCHLLAWLILLAYPGITTDSIRRDIQSRRHM